MLNVFGIFWHNDIVWQHLLRSEAPGRSLCCCTSWILWLRSASFLRRKGPHLGRCPEHAKRKALRVSEIKRSWEDLGRSGKIWEAEHWEMQTCTQRNTLSWTSTANLTRISESQHLCIDALMRNECLPGQLVSPSFHLAAEFNFIMIQDGIITCACDRKACSRSLCANSSNSKNNRNWKTRQPVDSAPL